MIISKTIRATLLMVYFCMLGMILPKLGGAMSAVDDYRENIKSKYKQINFSQEVSKENAAIIAQNYLIDEKFSDKDVVINKPTVANSGIFCDGWAVTFNSTLVVRLKNGLEWYAVHVDKKTGQIKAHGWGPS